MLFRKKAYQIGTALCLFLSVGPVSALDFITLNPDGNNDDIINQIDSTTLVTTTLGTFAGDGTTNNSPEIQLDPSGTILYTGNSCGSVLVSINTNTFAETVTTLTGMPVNTTTGAGNADSIHDSLGAMEFVGNTLYASTIACGPEEYDSALVTINTVTGVITEIGFSNLAHPTTGMAYDPVTSTMYGVSGTSNNNSQFFTIDLATGTASSIQQITFNGVQVDSITGLVLGLDGGFYAVVSSDNNGLFRTNLYQLDPATGALTDLGDTGSWMVAITGPQIVAPGAAPTQVPTLSQWALFALISLLGIYGVRRSYNQ